MQAIVSDIIVSQAVQNSPLPISQTFNTNSSNNVSFADMLQNLQSQKEKIETNDTAEPQKEQISEPKNLEDNQKPKEPENVAKEDDQKSVEKKADSKAASKEKTAESDRKVTAQENQSLPKQASKTDDKKSLPQTDTAKKTELKEAKNFELKKEELENPAKESVEVNEELANLVASNTDISAAVNDEKQTAPDLLKENKDLETASIETEFSSKSLSKDNFAETKTAEKITVVDMRTKVEEKASEPQEKNPKTNVKLEFNNENSATVTMELNQQAAGENILSLDNQTAASTGSDFQAMVSNQIQANAPDFVRAGTILLKDNDKGTINLVLHPDDLGNVKIHLSMDGKTLSAHITVNTKEALEVFKDNAQTLREAFAKSGFETANFDVSYNGSSNGQNQSFEEMYDGSQFIARKAYGDFLSGGETDGYIQDAYEFAANSEYSINIVA